MVLNNCSKMTGKHRLHTKQLSKRFEPSQSLLYLASYSTDAQKGREIKIKNLINQSHFETVHSL